MQHDAPPLPRPAPAIASDGLQFLPASARNCIALEDHLRREVASNQALQARVAELEALCDHLGVIPTFPDGFVQFKPLSEIQVLPEPPTVRVLPPPVTFTGVYVRGPSEVRMCAAAMVLRRASSGDELEVLLLQRAPTAAYGAGAWTMPAGGATPADVSLEGAAERELAEETGLTFRDLRVVRLVDGLSSKTGGFPFACAVVLGYVTDAETLTNREPETHSGADWFTVETLPTNTWDRAMIVDIMQREEEAHWSTDEHGNPSITQQVGGGA